MLKILKFALPLVFVAAFLVRLVGLNQSLWLDEAIGAIVVKTFSLRDIIFRFPLTDNHPPLYYLVLKIWTDIFGYSEIALRLPSVIFGVGTVFFVYKIARDFTKSNAVLAAILLATSPLHIYYSQEARMYSFAGFLAAGAVYFFLRSVKNSNSVVNWLVFSFIYTLLAFSDYVPIFLYPVFPLYALFKKLPFSWWKKFIFANIPLAILGFFWYPIFKLQGEKGKWLLETLPAWKNVAGGATLKQLGVFWSKLVLGRISFFNKTLYYPLIFLASLPILGLLAKSVKKLKGNEMFWFWFIIPITLGFTASFFFPAFIYFRFIFILPAFYLLIVLGGGRLLILAVLLFNLAGWGIYIFDSTQHREDWRGVAAYVSESAGPKEIALFENPEPFAPYQWYWDGRVPSFGATDSISAGPEGTRALVKDLTLNTEGVFYFEYLGGLQDPDGIVRSVLNDLTFKEIDRKAFNGVGFVIHYKKDGYLARDQSK